MDTTLTTAEVAELLGSSVGHVGNMRTEKVGPPYYKIGKKVIYRKKEVERWLEAHRVIPEESHGIKAG